MQLLEFTLNGYRYQLSCGRRKNAPNNNEEKPPFDSLSPIRTADEEGEYSKALDWALRNRKEKDIKNIAITGPYGSGKSSILKTFQQKYTGDKKRNYKFLEISLATFKEESDKKGKKINRKSGRKKQKEGNKDLLRLIELSVLQQIFYHEKDKKIPDSRFRKIKSLSKQLHWIIAAGAFLFVLAVLNLFRHEYFIDSLLDIGINNFWTSFFHYASLIIVIGGLGVVAFRFIRVLLSIRISKFSIHNAEIEISDKISKSIFNHHLDEILYFFEVTDYNVVIIEDLDRFEQTDVFTKLREINLLINNSEKVKDRIVFIYAVRDEMFQDKDRTKFFDFILPVIPVINTSNSNEILKRKCSENNYNISEDLIDDLALYIDDMRLLYNIINEFHIYHKTIAPPDQNRLLAIISYKNIFPDDFDALGRNMGVLYSTLQKRREFIRARAEEFDERISRCKEKIEELERLKIVDEKELKALYLLKYIEKLPSFISFRSKNEDCSIHDLLENKELFNQLVNGINIQYRYLNRYREYSIGTMPIKFEEVEDEVNSEKSYQERKKMIDDWTKDHIQSLKGQITILEQKKQRLRALKLRDLIANHEVVINKEDGKQNQLITVLLRSGYINEDYLDYITIFYPGSVTREDQQFILNVKSQIPSDYDYKLTRTEKIIPKINLFDFEKEYVLNYDLMDYLLESSSFNEQKELLFNYLSSEKAIAFIDGFVENGRNVGSFIKEICNHWYPLWKYVKEQIKYPDEKKIEYLKLIIEYADVSALMEMKKAYQFNREIAQKADFLEIIPDKERIKKVIDELDVHFENLEENRTPKELLQFVLDGLFFEMNANNLRVLIQEFGKYDSADFETRNYFAIKNSECEELISYVDENLEEYIWAVYLKLESNNNEAEETYLDLLNDENLELETKGELIDFVETIVENINDVRSVEVQNLLFTNSKVAPKWENVLSGYNINEGSINEELLHFLNNPRTVFSLTLKKMPRKVDEEEVYRNLCTKILYQTDIIDNSFESLIKSFPWRYRELDFSAFSSKRAKLLIDNDKVQPTVKNFVSLQENDGELNIYLLEKYSSEFVSIVDDLVFDGDEIEKILASPKIANTQKKVFLDTCTNETIVSNDNNLFLLADLFLEDANFSISDLILTHIIRSRKVDVQKRITIFHRENEFDNDDFIERFLVSLGSKYEKITDHSQRAVLEATDENRMLLEDLKDRGYISSYGKARGRKGFRVYHFR